MVYVANIVTVAEMQFYAGADIDTVGDVEANHIILQDHAEGYFSNLLKFELTSAAFSALNSTTKTIISEWAARYAAIQLISYNFLGEADALTRIESENRINVHSWRMTEIQKLLNEDTQNFLGV